MSKRWLYVLMGIVALSAVVVLIFWTSSRQAPNVSLLTVSRDIKAGKIASITIADKSLRVNYHDGLAVTAQKEPESTLVEQLTALGISQIDLDDLEITIAGVSPWDRVSGLFTALVPLLLVGGLAYVVVTKSPSFTNLSLFNTNSNQVSQENKPSVTFDDVAGVDEAKEELQEVVSFLKEPERFIEIGARTPKGVLLVGAPGTGKTLLAKAVAGESRVPFFNMSGSEFMEMYVGVGASRVRKLFSQAKKHSPSIIFIDEIDAVGRRRDAGGPSNNGERDQTLNQILVEIDGFDTETGIIVIAATNRPDVLDPALLRPGRFDRQVPLSPPDIKGREETFKVHLKGKPIDETVDAKDLARATPGFVGADMENVVNEAAILAVRQGKTTIGASEFDAAIERVIAGPEKRSRIISEEEKRIVAYHEAGHALMAHLLPECDAVRKISLIGRGAAAGYVLTMPEEDRHLVSCSKLTDDMTMVVGGRAAEEIMLGEITTGASNDLQKATEIARRMVTEYGMSEKVGPLSYVSPAHQEQPVNYSEDKAKEIDQEIKRLVEEAYERAKGVIYTNREALQSVVDVLLERETLSGEEFTSIFDAFVSETL